jgi:hypothetical protein
MNLGRSFTTRRWLLLTYVALGIATMAPAQPVSLAAKRITSAIIFDGKLDDPAWKDVPVVTLTQQSPTPSGETPYGTEVRVLVSSDTIYFGFSCHDPHPERIAIHTMRRDGDVTGYDAVSIVLDTYGDRQTGYFFQINAGGARVDGLIASVESASLDWTASGKRILQFHLRQSGLHHPVGA